MPVLCFKYKKQEKSESNTKLKDEPVHETKAKREDNDIIKIVKVNLFIFIMAQAKLKFNL